MRTQLAAACLVAAGLAAGCGAAPAGTTAPTALQSPAPTAAPLTGPTTAAPGTRDAAADQAAVREAFEDYNAALLARDFTTACAAMDPDAAAALQQAVRQQGGRAGTCAEAFGTVYSDPRASGPLDEASRSIRITDVQVAGDTATITYNGAAGGRSSGDLTGRLRRDDGRWLVLGNS